MRSFQTEQFSRFLPSPYAGHVKPVEAKHWRWYQSSDLAALLNLLYFAFTNSFLLKYRVKYYDYIVKWCSGIQFNWCVSMDITYFLALTIPGTYISSPKLARHSFSSCEYRYSALMSVHDHAKMTCFSSPSVVCIHTFPDSEAACVSTHYCWLHGSMTSRYRF